MAEFLAALQAFPNVIFTGLLGLALLYWLSVIIGALDIDLFSHHGGEPASDMAPGTHSTHGVFGFLSLGRVPITITGSVFILAAWSLGMFAEINLHPAVATVVPSVVYQAVMLAVLVVVSALIAAVAVRPLRGIFTMHTEHGEEGLVGKMVRITSLKASSSFGTAVYDHAGPGILLQITCRDGIEMKRDDMAVVVAYDATKSLYLVTPFAHLKPEEALAYNSLPTLPPPGPVPGSTAVSPVSLERPTEHPH